MPVHFHIMVNSLHTAKVAPFTAVSGAVSAAKLVSFISPRRVVLVGYHVLPADYVATAAGVPSLAPLALATAAVNVYVGAT